MNDGGDKGLNKCLLVLSFGFHLLYVNENTIFFCLDFVPPGQL